VPNAVNVGPREPPGPPAPVRTRRPGPVRILADDLTGALDTAAMLAADGPVPVSLDRPAPDDAAAVSVVATGTRHVPEQALAALLEPSLGWLSVAALPFKKVDSLLRGNSFVEVAAVLRGARYDRALFAPAFPAQGRFTIGGRLHVGAPGTAATAAREASAPGPLVDAFAALGLVAIVGEAALASLGAPAGSAGAPRVLIPDVTSDAALEQLAERALAASGRLLWCGSAGLARSLAVLGGWSEPRRPGDGHVPAARLGVPDGARADRRPPPLLVTATRHPVLRGQLARLREDTEVGCTIADLAGPEPLPDDTAAARLGAGAARVVAAHPRPAVVVVVGGDTLLALCRAAGVERLAAEPAPRSGWGAATLAGGAWSGVRCLTRSGAFGAPDDLSALLRGVAPAGAPTEPAADRGPTELR
jgi:uncharacterized protein YgbK (DUF1537 family)